MSRGCVAGGGGGERLSAVGIMMKQLKQATTKLFRKQRSGRRVVLLTTKATNGSGQMLVVDALVDEQHSTEQGRRQQQQFVVSRGHPSPLGASPTDKGINFALFSEHATAVSLCLWVSDLLLLLIIIIIIIMGFQWENFWTSSLVSGNVIPARMSFCFLWIFQSPWEEGFQFPKFQCFLFGLSFMGMCLPCSGFLLPCTLLISDKEVDDHIVFFNP